ncbi:type VI secretion system baseplate subunit TssG [Pseudoduganella sp. LjRoot289]|uniref:type VI secretion system baseplate subunit TssG n=1 Tax=Pseudoduganella sp. LjRoot289 TaxID=3342314 RepID=UPI003ECFCC50
MRDTKRQPAASLIDQLLAEPQRFEFFQAVRLLEQWLRESPQDPPLKLRFRNRLSLAFPPGEIAALEVTLGEIALTPAFMGLLGSTGAMPLHYTERMAAYEQSEDDGGPRAFFDMLSHRSLAMFCQAWATHRPECMRSSDADGGDGFLARLLSLSGAQSAPDGIIDRETFARYAIQARGRTVSPATMGGMLSDYFGVPFQVEALVGIWEKVSEAQQAQLGAATCSLDEGMLLGDCVYRCDTRARIRIGPLDKAGLERFLPGSEGAAALEAVLGMYCMVGMTFEVRLALCAEDVRAFSMNHAETTGGARLGIDAFLLDGPSPCDRDDLNYVMTP